MSFVSLEFAALFPLVFLVGWILRQWPNVWRIWLVAASAAFCATWSTTLLLVVVTLGLANHLLAGAIEYLGRLRVGATRIAMGVAVLANVGAIVVLRHSGALVDEVVDLASTLGYDLSVPAASTIVPLGVSFFALNGLGYVADVYRGDLAPLKPLDAAVLLTYFPTLMAGPLLQSDDLVPELRRVHDRPRIDVARVLRFLVGGMLKLVAIAPLLGERLVNPVFADPAAHDGLTILVAVYALAFQLYAIFSGATDLASGVSELLGIRLTTSFNAPYLATSVHDFWKRWNASVTRWFRAYVYEPLGGHGRGPITTARNLLVVALLVALWFDTTVPLLVWGAVHATLLVGERVLGAALSRVPLANRINRQGLGVVRWFLVFHAVCLAWIPFRADSLGTARAVVEGLITPGSLTVLSVGGVAVLIVMALAHVVPYEQSAGALTNLARPGPAFQGFLFAIGITIALAFAPDSADLFPYFGLQ